VNDDVRIPTPDDDLPVGPAPVEDTPELDEIVDCAVVGGGPAGLSAALCLARYRRSVAVLDTGEGRSTYGQINHNLLGYPGGIPARELRRLGRAQLAEYPQVRPVDACVDRIEPPEVAPVEDAARDDPDRAVFRLVTSAGVVRARTVLLATGVRDHFPVFDGWDGCVGRSMFWCIACDGYEHRDGKVVVIGNGDAAAGEALQLRRYSEDITVVTGSRDVGISPRTLARLARAGVAVVAGRIDHIDHTDGLVDTVHLDDGTALELEALFVAQGSTPASDLALALGARCNDAGWVVVDDEQRTSVPGLFAAGDVTAHHSHQISTALHEGTQAAAAINYALYPPALRLDD
jgi:thioredoxin reductase (NADPH)